MPKAASLTLQRWGNSLALRIPAAVARSVGFSVGRTVEITACDSGLLVTAKGDVRLSLEQKLALFDPKVHGGEVMAGPPVGKEVL